MVCFCLYSAQFSLYIFMNLFFSSVHTISSYHLQIFYSDLIFLVAILLCSCINLGGGCPSCSSSCCYCFKVKSTPSLSLTIKISGNNRVIGYVIRAIEGIYEKIPNFFSRKKKEKERTHPIFLIVFKILNSF